MLQKNIMPKDWDKYKSLKLISKQILEEYNNLDSNYIELNYVKKFLEIIKKIQKWEQVKIVDLNIKQINKELINLIKLSNNKKNYLLYYVFLDFARISEVDIKDEVFSPDWIIFKEEFKKRIDKIVILKQEDKIKKLFNDKDKEKIKEMQSSISDMSLLGMIMNDYLLYLDSCLNELIAFDELLINVKKISNSLENRSLLWNWANLFFINSSNWKTWDKLFYSYIDICLKNNFYILESDKEFIKSNIWKKYLSSLEEKFF